MIWLYTPTFANPTPFQTVLIFGSGFGPFFHNIVQCAYNLLVVLLHTIVS